ACFLLFGQKSLNLRENKIFNKTSIFYTAMHRKGRYPSLFPSHSPLPFIRYRDSRDQAFHAVWQRQFRSVRLRSPIQSDHSFRFKMVTLYGGTEPNGTELSLPNRPNEKRDFRGRSWILFMTRPKRTIRSTSTRSNNN